MIFIHRNVIFSKYQRKNTFLKEIHNLKAFYPRNPGAGKRQWWFIHGFESLKTSTNKLPWYFFIWDCRRVCWTYTMYIIQCLLFAYSASDWTLFLRLFENCLFAILLNKECYGNSKCKKKYFTLHSVIRSIPNLS